MAPPQARKRKASDDDETLVETYRDGEHENEDETRPRKKTDPPGGFLQGLTHRPREIPREFASF